METSLESLTMNYQERIRLNQNLKRQFRHNYPEGTIKWSNTTLEHFLVLCQVFDYMKRNGYEVWSECVFLNGCRADIVAIQGTSGFILEILHTEKDKRFKAKLEGKYGELEGFMVIPIKTQDFDIKTFKI